MQASLWLAVHLLSLLFDPEDGGTILIRNISKLLPDYTLLQTKRQYPSITMRILNLATDILLFQLILLVKDVL
jgi:hypothetical protein